MIAGDKSPRLFAVYNCRRTIGGRCFLELCVLESCRERGS